MREDYTDIAIVLDESGSMQSTKKDAIGGFNQFLAEQKAQPGFATLTVAKFSTTYDLLYSGGVIHNIPPLLDSEYSPGGGTALLDAIGKTIQAMGKRLSEMAEDQRPSKVIIVVITDGEENSSREFDRHKINEMIKHQEEVYKWQFVFIGSNQDAILTASVLSIKAQSSLSVGVGGEALKLGYSAMSRSVGNYRAGLSKSVEFTPDDRILQASLGAQPHITSKTDKDDTTRSRVDDLLKGSA